MCTTRIPIEDFNELTTFSYDYMTTSSLDCDLDIYNWTSGSWEQLQSNTGTSYITGSKILTSDYLSDQYNVQFRFQTETIEEDFDIRIDQLVVTYSKFLKKELT